MELVVTKEAIEKLNKLNQENNDYLLLWYDRDQCGCGVNGLPTIRFTNEKKDYYKEVQNSTMRTFITEQQAVFFNNELKLDYQNGCFRLTSPEQVLNPFIPENSICSI